MSVPKPFNAEPPVSNRTVYMLEQERNQKMHEQRLYEISSGKRRGNLGNRWNMGPFQSRPSYPHIRDNLKKQQMESERFDAIEHENRLLLEKMSALMASGSVVDPTEGTWEFQPGVRLNKFQMPVIDHAVSHMPQMPQRGAAKEPESLNWSLRKRELQRITQENQGIVTRIQGRGSSFPTQSQWAKRSEEHDQYLMLLRRPVTRDSMPTPPSPYVGPRGARRLRTPQSGKRSSSARAGRRGRSPVASELLANAKSGDAHVLVGLATGLSPGVLLCIAPETEAEDQVTVHENWLRKDGLVVLLKDGLRFNHPPGTKVLLS